MTSSNQPAVPAAAAVPGKRKAKRKTKATRKRAPQGKASKTHPSNAEAILRAHKALELRAEGKTFREIAAELGYNSPQAAHKAVMTAIHDHPSEAVENVRRMHLLRLDKLWELHYINAQTGDNFATASCLRIMERQARLQGLDAPVETKASLEHTVTPGGVLVVPTPVTEDQWLAAAAKSQDALRAAENSVRLDGSPS